jgi:hypothetical protein
MLKLMLCPFPPGEEFFISRHVSNYNFTGFAVIQFHDPVQFPAAAVGKTGNYKTIIEF